MSSGVMRLAVLIAMPMLTVITTSRPSTVNGCCSSLVRRSATEAGALSSLTSSIRIANSSPPSRAIVSSGRRQDASRWLTPIRS